MQKVTHEAPLALVVEENDEARTRIATLLGETELGVITCGSGETAVEVLQRCGEDVVMVLTAAALRGEMDGHHLAKAANRLLPGIRVVIGSGTAEPPDGPIPSGTIWARWPWLPLDVLVQAHAALRAPRRETARLTA